MNTSDSSGCLQNKPTIDEYSRIKVKHGAAVAFLKKQFRQGFWPYRPGLGPSTEATAWCAIALRDNKPVMEQALSYLFSTQNKDGGWATSPSAGQSDWTSALAILAIRTLTKTQAVDSKIKRSIDKGFDFLFSHRTEIYRAIGRLLIFLDKGPEGLQYAKGWPWTPGCFHWVEPTSYSLISLKSPKLPDNEVFSEVVKHANAFLIEHVCKGGGWNHGNQLCLGVDLPPYTVTTAEALLALQDVKNAQAVKKSIAYLIDAIHKHPTAMSMSWSALALHAHGYNTIREVCELMKLQHDDGSFGRDLMVTGLASTALGILIDGNPFLYG